jgi:GMP synthase-like glutamine amidotransferase
MKPVAIFRHFRTEGPGYFATVLDRARLPWHVVKIDAGDAVPRSAREFSGLVFMGGPMSVNDELPWLPPVFALIRDAVAADVPVLGHCLGGQLMAKAMGATVGRSAVKEIGWGEVQVVPGRTTRDWFGDAQSFAAFHWHGETFTIPPGAERVLASAHCANQAFVFGKHFAMQCHIEMTPGMIADWCEGGAREIAAARDSPAVQPASVIQAEVGERLPALHAIADRVYARWIEGLENH